MGNEGTDPLREIFRVTLKLSDPSELEASVRGESPWDSLAHVMLIAGVESEYGISIDIDQALELRTLQDFRDLIAREQGAGRIS